MLFHEILLINLLYFTNSLLALLRSNNSRTFAINSDSVVFDSVYFDGEQVSISSSNDESSDELGITIRDSISLLVVDVDNADLILFSCLCGVR
jgi:hypothetical protein